MIKRVVKSLGLMVGVVLLLGQSLVVSAVPDVTLGAYFIPTTYTDQLFKLDTTVVGAYGFFGFGGYSIETGYDQILGTQSRASVQQNYLGIFTYYLPTMRLKLGYMGIRPNGGSGNGSIFISGIGQDFYDALGYKTWTVGSDFYFSTYETTRPTKIYQLSPYVKANTATPWGTGWLEWSGTLNGEFVSSTRQLYSEEVGVKYHWDAFTVGVEAQAGESTYGVNNGGFVVINTGDRMQGGISFSGSYAQGPFSFTLNYLSQQLIPEGSTQTSTMTKIGGLATFHF